MLIERSMGNDDQGFWSEQEVDLKVHRIIEEVRLIKTEKGRVESAPLDKKNWILTGREEVIWSDDRDQKNIQNSYQARRRNKMSYRKMVMQKIIKLSTNGIEYRSRMRLD